MITEVQIRNIAARAATGAKNAAYDERQLIIENAIREALMHDRKVEPEPNAGCL